MEQFYLRCLANQRLRILSEMHSKALRKSGACHSTNRDVFAGWRVIILMNAMAALAWAESATEIARTHAENYLSAFA